MDHNDFFDCLLVYFQNSQSNKSLWSTYSMLKSCLIIYDNTDISKYAKLIAYLKQITKQYQPKKSAVLTEEQITKFIVEAPSSLFLLMKVKSFPYFKFHTTLYVFIGCINIGYFWSAST